MALLLGIKWKFESLGTRKKKKKIWNLVEFMARCKERNHFFSSRSTAFFECDSTMPPTAVTVHFKACVTSINNVPSVGVQRVISPSALLRQNNSILCLICHLTNAPLKGPQLPPTISPITAAVWLPACTCCVAQIYNVDSRFGYLHLLVWAVLNFVCLF